MFAVIKTGGKQFRVAHHDVVTIPKLEGEVGSTVTFEEILTLSHDGGIEIGLPGVSGATVAGEIVSHGRGDKVIAFKKRRRQNSRRKRGHRQHHTVVRIDAFSLNGSTFEAPPKPARPTKPAAPVAESAEEA